MNLADHEETVFAAAIRFARRLRMSGQTNLQAQLTPENSKPTISFP